jgi:hypothetical protein
MKLNRLPSAKRPPPRQFPLLMAGLVAVLLLLYVQIAPYFLQRVEQFIEEHARDAISLAAKAKPVKFLCSGMPRH